MVLRLLPFALLLASAAIQAQEPARAPTPAKPTNVSTGWFGFRHGVERDSLVVLEVAADSPADRAGLRQGDRITMIDGKPASQALLAGTPLTVGDIRRLTVHRDRKSMTVAMVAVNPPPGTLMPARKADLRDTVESAARELRGEMVLKATRAPTKKVTIDSVGNADITWTMKEGRKLEPLIIVDGQVVRGDTLLASMKPIVVDSKETYDVLLRTTMEADRIVAKLHSNAISGAEFEQLNPGLADYFDGVSEGVFVLRVADGTPAATAGLRPGDIVQTVNGFHVATITEMRTAVSEATGTVTLRVLRKGRPATVILRKE